MVKQRKGVKEELITPMKPMEPKTIKPTPEQMRIAQIMEKKVLDSTIKLKLKQIMDATQRSADEVYVALHDSDFDVNRAVNLLIEGDNQLADWCTNEKRKKKVVEEKKEEVEVEAVKPERKPRGRGDNRRRPGQKQDGRGQKTREETKRPQATKAKRPGFGSLVFERSNLPPTGTFLPPVKNQWEKPLIRNTEDDWDCEEFQGSLSQTQIFTSSKKPDPKEEERQTPVEPSNIPLLSSLTFTNKARDLSNVIISQDEVQDMPGPPPTETEYLYRLNYTKQEEKKPSKIPTSAVEMPPEMNTSLSFLDIQFGAMELGPSDTSSESLSNHSNPPSQAASTTTLLPPSSIPSTTSIKTSNSAASSANPSMNTVANNNVADTTINSIANSIANVGISNIANPCLNSIANTTISSVTNPGSVTSPAMTTPVNMVPPSISEGIGHLMASNNNSLTSASASHTNAINHNLIGSTGSNQSRFIQSSQSFNGSHLQYGIINPPGSSHGFEPRDSPPHHPSHSHLPPFKSPPGVPKGTIVPNLPPGALVGNQYIVGQGNVPYFPHPPIYYYEEVPTVMNSQQRLTTMTSHTHHYDVGYQAPPSSRDNVHYNV